MTGSRPGALPNNHAIARRPRKQDREAACTLGALALP